MGGGGQFKFGKIPKFSRFFFWWLPLNSFAKGHSKSENLVKVKFAREKYFEDPNFSKSEVELLFALRTRTVRNIKKNFPSQYNNNNMACQVCFMLVDCQQHLLMCSELRKRVNNVKLGIWGYFKTFIWNYWALKHFLFKSILRKSRYSDQNRLEATDMDVARQRMLFAAHTSHPLRGGLKIMPKHTPAKKNVCA